MWLLPYSQGPEVTATRDVSTNIPITQIPSVMRALGFYPSEQEVNVTCYITHVSQLLD